MTIAVLLGTSYLYLQGSGLQSGPPRPESTPATGSALDREAEAVAETFVQGAYHKCGEFYFLRYHSDPKLNPSPTFMQIKGFEWKLEGREIVNKATEAQRLNNLPKSNVMQWDGKIRMRGTAFRWYTPSYLLGEPGYGVPKWHLWQDLPPAQDLEPEWGIKKVDGKWHVMFGGNVLGEDAERRVDGMDCDAIPAG